MTVTAAKICQGSNGGRSPYPPSERNAHGHHMSSVKIYLKKTAGPRILVGFSITVTYSKIPQSLGYNIFVASHISDVLGC